jgi:hypothetical protein
MRTYVFAAVCLLASSSFINGSNPFSYFSYSENDNRTRRNNVFDLTVHRLSGDRVMITWHADGESVESQFEVMRKHGVGIFTSLGVVEPGSMEDNLGDFSFIDVNRFADSSFYCVKETAADSVVFFSVTKGIEGIGKER